MYETTRLAIAMRMARAARQWSQQEMADRLAVSKNVITRNEKPDMAMRADTLVKLIYLMREISIDLDVFNTSDSVRFYAEGNDLDAMAMRVSRAALNLSQQAFADKVGLTKPLVTRGEQPDRTMQSRTFLTMSDSLYSHGITIEHVPMVRDLTVTVHPQAVQWIEGESKDTPLSDEPNLELAIASSPEKNRNKANKNYTADKNKG